MKSFSKTLIAVGLLLCGAVPAVAATNTTYLVGDIDLDGQLTVGDVIQLARMVNDPSLTDNSLNTDATMAKRLLAADVNGDTKITQADVVELRQMVLGLKPTVRRDSSDPQTPVGGSTGGFD